MGRCNQDRNFMDELRDIICSIEKLKPEPEVCNVRCPPLGCPTGPCPGMCSYQGVCDPCCVSQMPCSPLSPEPPHCCAPACIPCPKSRCPNPCKPPCPLPPCCSSRQSVHRCQSSRSSAAFYSPTSCHVPGTCDPMVNYQSSSICPTGCRFHCATSFNPTICWLDKRDSTSSIRCVWMQSAPDGRAQFPWCQSAGNCIPPSCFCPTGCASHQTSIISTPICDNRCQCGSTF